MTVDYRNVGNVKELLKENNIEHLIFDSFDDAKNSGEAMCVVLFEDVGNTYELHVVGTVGGDFVEYAVWEDVEIKDDKELADNIWYAIVDLLTQPTDEDKADKAFGQYGWYKTIL